MMQSRTHTCGELRLTDAGKTVTIVGWLENVREVGSNFAFCVLRDYYGTTQVVIENEEMMRIIKPINKESTLSVTGVVRERESKNTKIPTGDIEVVPEKIEVLGKCVHNQLPFEINKSKDADENTRLKYRFLDLRNPAVKSNIVLRCQVVAEMQQQNPYNIHLIYRELLTPQPMFENYVRSKLYRIHQFMTELVEEAIACGEIVADIKATHVAFTLEGIIMFFFL